MAHGTSPHPPTNIQLETGVSEPALLKIIAAIAVGNLVLGLLPRSPTYSPSNQKRMAERDRTSSRELQQEKGLLWPLSKRNGFLNKRNELVVGRTAMLLFVVVRGWYWWVLFFCTWDLCTQTHLKNVPAGAGV